MAFLKYSSDWLDFLNLLETIEEDEEESFLACGVDLVFFLACWFNDLMV